MLKIKIEYQVSRTLGRPSEVNSTMYYIVEASFPTYEEAEDFIKLELKKTTDERQMKIDKVYYRVN